MQIILVVSEIKNFLLMSMKKGLESVPYQVTILPADTDAINGIKGVIDGILIYTDEKLILQQKALHFLKDKAVTEDIPIFVVGRPDELEEVKIMIPKHLIRREFIRPVKVSNLVNTIDKTIKQCNVQNEKKILVIDDSSIDLRRIKGWLENKYKVYLANSGAMAIKYMAVNRPDLILLDYEMPICDGKRFMEMMRAEMEFVDIPVMFLTIREDEESILKVKPLKPEKYLFKSMDPSAIIKSINDFFEKRKEKEIHK
ncbi:MAG: response regulator [Lachnoclostridium sp.]|jgi:response regulator RpfG family c-di-GMP phosphodiesterase|nr:response regulator [Lachnoclostridium sp.]